MRPTSRKNMQNVQERFSSEYQINKEEEQRNRRFERTNKILIYQNLNFLMSFQKKKKNLQGTGREAV